VFWRSFVVLLTNRIDPKFSNTNEWIRLRPAIPPDCEDVAMASYSLFYYAACTRIAMEHDRQRIDSGAYGQPEFVFFLQQLCVENAKPLRLKASDLLSHLGLHPSLPEHPQTAYMEIGAYRNAFAHNPVLGRAVGVRRGLLPPVSALPRRGVIKRWSDLKKIPPSQMVDSTNLQERLWGELEKFMQDLWTALARHFVEARASTQFAGHLGISSLLPIRMTLPDSGLAGPPGASGTMLLARSDAPIQF